MVDLFTCCADVRVPSQLQAQARHHRRALPFSVQVSCVWHFTKPRWDVPAVCTGAVRHGHQSGASYSAVRTPWQLADSELIDHEARHELYINDKYGHLYR